MKKTLLLAAVIVCFHFSFANAELSAFPICTAGGTQCDPDISGKIVVWTDYRNGNADIYGCYLETMTEFPVCVRAGDQTAPAVSGDFVVWVENADIHVLNLRTWVESAVEAGPNQAGSPDISGGVVVWEEVIWGEHGYYRSFIRGMDLQTGLATSDLDSLTGKPRRPVICAGKIVYEDENMKDVRGFDLNRNELFFVCNNDAYQHSQAIDENVVIWTDLRNGSSDIYAFDLGTQTEQAICTNNSEQIVPAVAGRVVVWQDYRNLNWDLYGFNAETQSEFAVCLDGSRQSEPAAAEGVVVWVDYRNGNADIYGAYLSGRAVESSDFCETAVLVTANEPFYGMTRYATGTDISSIGHNDTRDAWNKYTPVRGGTVTISTEGSTFDTVLSVYEGCGGAELACNDDYASDSLCSQIVMNVTEGKTYYVRVAGFDGAAGDYDLLITTGECADRPRSDLTGDCKVTLEDYMILASEWMTCGYENPDDC